MTHLGEAVAAFLAHERRRNLSAATLYGMEAGFNRFLRFAWSRDLQDVRRVSAADLRAYRAYLRTQKGPQRRALAHASVAGNLRQVKRFFRFLAREDILLIDPARDLVVPRGAEYLPREILTPGQVAALLRRPDLCTPAGFRDRTILELMYSAALRVGEVHRISIYDLDFSHHTLLVHGKGRKERLVPLGRTAGEYVREYLAYVRPLLLGGNTTQALFLRTTGSPITRDDVARMFQRHRKEACLPAALTPHCLRHTCATELLRGGADLRYVQELLGHAAIATTQRYTRLVPADLRQAYDKAHTSPWRNDAQPPPPFAGNRLRACCKRRPRNAQRNVTASTEKEH